MGETLKKRAGPLPVWAWVALLVVVLGGYMYYKRKRSINQQTASSSNQATSSNLGTVPISNLTVGAEPMPTENGPTFVNVSPPNVNITGGAGGQGGQGGSGGTTVVNNPSPPTPPPKNPITPTKPPAQPLPPAPKPAPVPAPKANTQSVTVCPYPAWCGSLWGIAQHFYGNGALWPQIYAANKGIIGGNPDLIHPGQVLTIPAA